MFVQVIRGKAADKAAIEQALDRWNAELRPGAEGFLGSTAGFTDDDQVVLVARFSDEESARRNSDRAEQGAWGGETEPAFDGPVDFFDSTDVDESMGGGSDDAGFVQVLIGRGDREQARASLEKGEEVLRRERPDLIGGITAWADDGRFVDVAYFTSEDEARAGESKEMSDEGRELFEQFTSAMPVDEYLDLRDLRFA